MRLCILGIHKWGKVKQWIVNGNPIMARKCKGCGKIDTGKGEKK